MGVHQPSVSHIYPETQGKEDPKAVLGILRIGTDINVGVTENIILLFIYLSIYIYYTCRSLGAC